MSVYNSNEEAEKIEDAEIEEELDPRIQVNKFSMLLDSYFSNNKYEVLIARA